MANLGVVRSIEGSLRDIAERKLLKEENFPEDRIAELTKEVSLSTMKVEKGKEKKGGFIGEYLLSVLLVSLLFGVIMGYGQILMRGVVEEKNARIIEVLLSSVDSFRLLLGKVFGVGLAGLLQVGIWCFMLFGSYFYFTSYLPMEFQGFTLSPSIFLSFALFFVLGYFLYSTLFAIAGAVSNTDQEAQQFLQPIMFLILIPFIIAFSTIQNPDNTAVVLLSFFPFFTPILMFVRTAFSTPPLWQIALSLGLLVLTTLGITYLSAKIFRIGILSYGKKPNLKEILLWLKVK
ncbi:MAG: ABC-2 family transporter protein [Candidatus Aminicenantes bacterium ADurb.Bin508]|nr:MAG: ABC-2 family transporter protein [Candidatus Aminicenantes bacterium ADurb.Bin508]